MALWYPFKGETLSLLIQKRILLCPNLAGQLEHSLDGGRCVYNLEPSESTTTTQFSSTREMEDNVTSLRIIVMTFNRPKSLEKLLAVLDLLEMDGDRAEMEIWIDRNLSGQVDNKTVEVARNFIWMQGTTSVHIHEKHVGLYGQWIGTWKPDPGNPKEFPLFLEDDVSVSPLAYRWLKAVHGHFGNRTDYAGVSIESGDLKPHAGFRSRLLVDSVPGRDTVFMYKCLGSHGFSPKPAVWKEFQDWYHSHKNLKKFHPYVPGILPTKWYQSMERSGRTQNMWTMWFIYFTYIRELYTVYNNLGKFNGDTRSCIGLNRKEVGANDWNERKKGREDNCTMLDKWDPIYSAFPAQVVKLNWDGIRITNGTYWTGMSSSDYRDRVS